MKKFVKGIVLISFAINFVGCATTHSNKSNQTVTSQAEQQRGETSMEWLQGSWYSQEWEVTYDFSQVNGQWLIKNDQTIVAEQAKLEKQTQPEAFHLVSKDGTNYHIIKVTATKIQFQQTAKEGLLGTTKQVEFIKK